MGSHGLTWDAMGYNSGQGMCVAKIHVFCWSRASYICIPTVQDGIEGHGIPYDLNNVYLKVCINIRLHVSFSTLHVKTHSVY